MMFIVSFFTFRTMYADPNLKSAITDTLISIINTGCGSASTAEEALKALEVTESELGKIVYIKLFSLHRLPLVLLSLWSLPR